jgi:hypothetical protein
MRILNLMTFLTYMMYAKNYRMANIAYNLLINNIREEKAIKERSKSEPRHIAEILKDMGY